MHEGSARHDNKLPSVLTRSPVMSPGSTPQWVRRCYALDRLKATSGEVWQDRGVDAFTLFGLFAVSAMLVC
jgi:hypothetical protein